MRLSKWWLRLERRTSGPADDRGGLRDRLVTVGPAQYYAMGWTHEHWPQGVFRSLWVFSRLGLIWGPGDGAVEMVPDGARYRVWWTRNNVAVSLCWVPATPEGPDAA